MLRLLVHLHHTLQFIRLLLKWSVIEIARVLHFGTCRTAAVLLDLLKLVDVLRLLGHLPGCARFLLPTRSRGSSCSGTSTLEGRYLCKAGEGRLRIVLAWIVFLKFVDLPQHVVVLLLIICGSYKVWPIHGDAHDVHLA